MKTGGPWRFSLDLLPVSGNHQFAPRRGRNGALTGQWVLTEEARSVRDAFTLAARAAGFRPSLERTYRVRLVFTVPSWSGRDLDNLTKGTLDAIVGQRYDHRVVRLEVEKRVQRGVRRTDVEIWECT